MRVQKRSSTPEDRLEAEIVFVFSCGKGCLRRFLIAMEIFIQKLAIVHSEKEYTMSIKTPPTAVQSNFFCLLRE